MVTIGCISIIVAISVFLGGISMRASMETKSERSMKWYWLVICGLILGTLCQIIINTNQEIGEQKSYKILSREASARLIPIKGKCVFDSQIRIIYSDGRLDKVLLIPGTTKKEK